MLITVHGEKTLVEYYWNPDVKAFGFGFLTGDGGGFLPESDLSDATTVRAVTFEIGAKV